MKAQFHHPFRLTKGENKGQLRYAYKIVEATDDELVEFMGHSRFSGEKASRDEDGVPFYITGDTGLGEGIITVEITKSGAIVHNSLRKMKIESTKQQIKDLGLEKETAMALAQTLKDLTGDIDASIFELKPKEKAPVSDNSEAIVQETKVKRSRKKKDEGLDAKF